MSDSLVVQVTDQRRGCNFILHPADQIRIDEFDPADPPAENVFVGRQPRDGDHGITLEAVGEQVVQLLTGMSVGRVLEEFGAVEFESMPDENVTHTIQMD